MKQAVPYAAPDTACSLSALMSPPLSATRSMMTAHNQAALRHDESEPCITKEASSRSAELLSSDAEDVSATFWCRGDHHTLLRNTWRPVLPGCIETLIVLYPMSDSSLADLSLTADLIVLRKNIFMKSDQATDKFRRKFLL